MSLSKAILKTIDFIKERIELDREKEGNEIIKISRDRYIQGFIHAIDILSHNLLIDEIIDISEFKELLDIIKELEKRRDNAENIV